MNKCLNFSCLDFLKACGLASVYDLRMCGKQNNQYTVLGFGTICRESNLMGIYNHYVESVPKITENGRFRVQKNGTWDA